MSAPPPKSKKRVMAPPICFKTAQKTPPASTITASKDGEKQKDEEDEEEEELTEAQRRSRRIQRKQAQKALQDYMSKEKDPQKRKIVEAAFNTRESERTTGSGQAHPPFYNDPRHPLHDFYRQQTLSAAAIQAQSKEYVPSQPIALDAQSLNRKLVSVPLTIIANNTAAAAAAAASTDASKIEATMTPIAEVDPVFEGCSALLSKIGPVPPPTRSQSLPVIAKTSKTILQEKKLDSIKLFFSSHQHSDSSTASLFTGFLDTQQFRDAREWLEVYIRMQATLGRNVDFLKSAANRLNELIEMNKTC